MSQSTWTRMCFTFVHAPCGDDVEVDVYVPRPEPIQEGAEQMADRYRPPCPICKLPMTYLGWAAADGPWRDP